MDVYNLAETHGSDLLQGHSFQMLWIHLEKHSTCKNAPRHLATEEFLHEATAKKVSKLRRAVDSYAKGRGVISASREQEKQEGVQPSSPSNQHLYYEPLCKCRSSDALGHWDDRLWFPVSKHDSSSLFVLFS